MAESGSYLYAVARDIGDVPACLTGVAETAVRAVARGGLTAYVSTVPLTQFGEDALRRNLEDLAWLEATARAHHRVVGGVARAAPTAPVRLVTVYSGDEQVCRLLEDRSEEFGTVLSNVAGRQEWGVKVYVDPKDAVSSEPADEGGTGARRPGTAYLKRRRTSLRSRESTWRAAVERAEEIDAALTAVAVAARRHHTQDPQLSGRDDWMVLNGAYLVDAGRGQEFAALTGTLAGGGVDVQLTGPWAPYSFTAELGGQSTETRA
ncbi:MAG: hypothetical protein JWR24_4958 [Actinoallomurus sp.]|nr:hypothetical protein [Actinoallomurus sp.]